MSLMKVDLHIQDWVDFRVSRDVSSSEHSLVNFVLFRKFFEFLLVFSQQVSLYGHVSLKGGVGIRNSVATTIASQFSFSACFSCIW